MLNRDSLLIFLIGIFVLTIGFGPEFLGLDARFGVFAQEMMRNGPTFFPTTYGHPYPDYPATSTFVIYLVSLLFGKVTPFSAVLPTAIVSAIILVFTYRIGAIHSRMWGLCAVVLTLFTNEFFNLSLSLSPDQYVSLATVLSFYLAYSANVYGRKKRLWFIPLILAASFAFRGPIGLIIPAGVLCGYYLYARDFKKCFVMAVSSLAMLVVCGAGLLAAAQYQGGASFVKQVIDSQALGRLQPDRHGFEYYWVQSFVKYAATYPLVAAVVVFRFREILRRENPDFEFLGYLIVWVFVILFGMSIPGAKKMRYIVPMVPAAALVASYMFISPQKSILFGIKEIFLKFCSWFPAGAGIFALIFWVLSAQIAAFAMRVSGKQVPPLFEGYCLVTMFLMAILTAAVWYVNVRLKEGSRRDLTVMTIGAATFIIITVCIEKPVSYSLNRTRPFVEKVETLQKQKHGEIVFYKITSDGDAIKFMVNLDKPLEPQFINSAEVILNCKEPAYFIAKDEDFADLPKDVMQYVTVLARGEIGCDDCIVFTCTEIFRKPLKITQAIN